MKQKTSKGNQVPGRQSRGKPLIITHQPTKASGPGERAFHHPSAGQQHKAVLGIRQFHDFACAFFLGQRARDSSWGNPLVPQGRSSRFSLPFASESARRAFTKYAKRVVAAALSELEICAWSVGGDGYIGLVNIVTMPEIGCVFTGTCMAQGEEGRRKTGMIRSSLEGCFGKKSRACGLWTLAEERLEPGTLSQ